MKSRGTMQNSKTRLAAFVFVAVFSTGCLTPHTAPFDHAAQADQKAAAGCPNSVTDGEGYSYTTVLIGGQCWFAENLRVAKYRDGSAIPDEQLALIDLEKYGRLYRWPAVSNSAGLCPEGWHVPTDAEFQQLEVSVGMPADTAMEAGWRGKDGEARRLKQFDVARSWTPDAKAEVNQSGFSGLAGGGSSGSLTTADGLYGDYWTSTEHNEERAWYRSLTWWSMHPSRNRIRRTHVDKGQGSSVRCLLDSGSPSAD